MLVLCFLRCFFSLSSARALRADEKEKKQRKKHNPKRYHISSNKFGPVLPFDLLTPKFIISHQKMCGLPTTCLLSTTYYLGADSS